MNSRYWGKTVIKLLHLTNSMYNFSNNGSQTENSGIKTRTLVRGHLSRQGTLATEHVSTQGTLAREHVSTILACRTSNLADWNTNYIYRNDLDKACLQNDMAYGKYKDLTKRTESDKVLKDKAFKIASNPKFNGYERRLASVVYKFFD